MSISYCNNMSSRPCDVLSPISCIICLKLSLVNVMDDRALLNINQNEGHIIDLTSCT